MLEKGLDFVPVQRTLNEPELRNEVSETFSEIPSFRSKSSWLPPKGHASLEILLSQLEKNFLQMILMSHCKVICLPRNEKH